MKEFRVQGPPGCGKTTYIKTQTAHAAASYGANRVAVCSFSRAAASHIAGKVEIPRDNIGTLHGFAYRALPGVEIAEVKAAEFNDWCATERLPTMKLSASTRKVDLDNDDLVDVPTPGETAGDRLQGDMNRFRARMIPRAAWPESVRAFATVWERWKKEAGYLDFTDLLEIALRDVVECPTKPAALFCDESQDFSRLAFSLARKWGERCLRFIHVGDPDQVLYDWAGVDIRAFYEGDLPELQTRLLHQSYRVPGAVHSAAVKWINETPGRKPIVYDPRRVDPKDNNSAVVEGKVSRCAATTYSPRLAIEDAKRRIGDGKTCLFLVSCSFMLTRIIAELRNCGIPFHNPYRVTRGDWNPLRIGGSSPASRLAAFAKIGQTPAAGGGMWTNKDVGQWSAALSAKEYMVHGARTYIEECAKERPTDIVDLSATLNLFKQGFWEYLVDGDLDWYAGAVEKKHKEKIEYPLSIYKGRGFAALAEAPPVIVSTIHAAKGGEADICYLFPDLSPQGYSAWMGRGDGKEGVRRGIYVALTRTREELVLCGAASNSAIRI